MNKAELVDAISKKTERSFTARRYTKKDIDEILTAFTEVVTQQVRRGGSVKLVGFGTFCRRETKERLGRNPQTGEQISIPAKTKPAFAPGKEFKRIVEEG